MSVAEVSTVTNGEKQEYVTMYIDDQLFGLPVLSIQDIIGSTRLTPIPLASNEIAGVLNLRGRIVTVFDLREKLGLPKKDDEEDRYMNIVIEKGEDLYSVLVDRVGEVLSLDKTQFEHNPGTLTECWKSISQGVYKLEEDLLVLLDVDKVINYQTVN